MYNLELKYIPNFDYLFKDKAFIKGFIWQVAKTCNDLKIETNNQFDFIFAKKNKKKTNTYHIIDIDILNIAFINYLELNNDEFHNEIIDLFIKDKDYFQINLIISLGRINLLYYNLNNFRNYSMYRYSKTDLYILDFTGVAIKLEQIINVVDDEILTEVLRKIIKSKYSNFFNYLMFKKKKKNKTYNYFDVQKSKKYKEIFKESKNDFWKFTSFNKYSNFKN